MSRAAWGALLGKTHEVPPQKGLSGHQMPIALRPLTKPRQYRGTVMATQRGTSQLRIQLHTYIQHSQDSIHYQVNSFQE